MAIKVVTDIPIPAQSAERKSPIGVKKYPWDDMNVVGASFLFPAEFGLKLKLARSIASKRQRIDDRTYLVRKDHETGEVRCWVTALKAPEGIT
jgi:hypothetical protein